MRHTNKDIIQGNLNLEVKTVEIKTVLVALGAFQKVVCCAFSLFCSKELELQRKDIKMLGHNTSKEPTCLWREITPSHLLPLSV